MKSMKFKIPPILLVIGLFFNCASLSCAVASWKNASELKAVFPIIKTEIEQAITDAADAATLTIAFDTIAGKYKQATKSANAVAIGTLRDGASALQDKLATAFEALNGDAPLKTAMDKVVAIFMPKRVDGSDANFPVWTKHREMEKRVADQLSRVPAGPVWKLLQNAPTDATEAAAELRAIGALYAGDLKDYDKYFDATALTAARDAYVAALSTAFDATAVLKAYDDFIAALGGDVATTKAALDTRRTAWFGLQDIVNGAMKTARDDAVRDGIGRWFAEADLPAMLLAGVLDGITIVDAATAINSHTPSDYTNGFALFQADNSIKNTLLDANQAALKRHCDTRAANWTAWKRSTEVRRLLDALKADGNYKGTPISKTADYAGLKITLEGVHAVPEYFANDDSVVTDNVTAFKAAEGAFMTIDQMTKAINDALNGYRINIAPASALAGTITTLPKLAGLVNGIEKTDTTDAAAVTDLYARSTGVAKEFTDALKNDLDSAAKVTTAAPELAALYVIDAWKTIVTTALDNVLKGKANLADLEAYGICLAVLAGAGIPVDDYVTALTPTTLAEWINFDQYIYAPLIGTTAENIAGTKIDDAIKDDATFVALLGTDPTVISKSIGDLETTRRLVNKIKDKPAFEGFQTIVKAYTDAGNKAVEVGEGAALGLKEAYEACDIPALKTMLKDIVKETEKVEPLVEPVVVVPVVEKPVVKEPEIEVVVPEVVVPPVITEVVPEGRVNLDNVSADDL